MRVLLVMSQTYARARLLLLKYSRLLHGRTLMLPYLRHVWSVLYRRRCLTAFLGLLAVFGSLIYTLLSWGIVCSNVEVWHHVRAVCQQYRNGEAVGNLCPPLCEHGRIHGMNCKPLHAGKELVFSAILDGIPLVFKSSRRSGTPDIRTSVYWLDGNGNQHYPKEDEFTDMIAALVSTEMNVTANQEQLQKLSQLGPVPTRSEMRHTEMDNLWALLQDHEYLAIRLFTEQEIFPTLIGSCGGFFAVEYAEPLSGGGLWEHEDEIWADRLRNAVLLLELLERVESSPPVPLRLCDVRLEHFGKSFDGGKIVILDGDSVVTTTVANALAGDGQICRAHLDCHYFDCHATCEWGRCVPPSINNNLQAVCEKVMLGHKWQGALLVPGMLASPHASPALSTLLRLCAFPHGEEGPRYGTPDDIRDRFQATVEEMVNEIDLRAM